MKIIIGALLIACSCTNNTKSISSGSSNNLDSLTTKIFTSSSSIDTTGKVLNSIQPTESSTKNVNYNLPTAEELAEIGKISVSRTGQIIELNRYVKMDNNLNEELIIVIKNISKKTITNISTELLIDKSVLSEINNQLRLKPGANGKLKITNGNCLICKINTKIIRYSDGSFESY